MPSGEVGGDLVDFVEMEGRWIGYVVDVAVAGSPVMASSQYFEEVMSRVRRFGPQEDDQTLLTVKCL
ncbi:MAG: hypothetical protein V3T83_14945 [Acidobacteriota bacterium]